METITPLWLGLIIVLAGFIFNTLGKLIEKGSGFSCRYWWKTNRLKILFSLSGIILLLLLFPDLPRILEVNGSEVMGERLMYALIGYTPLKILRLLFKSTNLDK